jgi:hypothetical protein
MLVQYSSSKLFILNFIIIVIKIDFSLLIKEESSEIILNSRNLNLGTGKLLTKEGGVIEE